MPLFDPCFGIFVEHPLIVGHLRKELLLTHDLQMVLTFLVVCLLVTGREYCLQFLILLLRLSVLEFWCEKLQSVDTIELYKNSFIGTQKIAIKYSYGIYALKYNTSYFRTCEEFGAPTGRLSGIGCCGIPIPGRLRPPML